MSHYKKYSNFVFAGREQMAHPVFGFIATAVIGVVAVFVVVFHKIHFTAL